MQQRRCYFKPLQKLLVEYKLPASSWAEWYLSFQGEAMWGLRVGCPPSVTSSKLRPGPGPCCLPPAATIGLTSVPAGSPVSARCLGHHCPESDVLPTVMHTQLWEALPAHGGWPLCAGDGA